LATTFDLPFMTIQTTAARTFLLLGLGFASLTAVSRAAEPTIQDVAFRAELDDREERYVLMLPADFDSRQPHDLLLALHGHGSDRWQFVKQPRDECRAARDVAAKHRLIFISPDYRAATSWMGPAAEADVVQIVAAAKRQFTVRRVIVSGGSMGGTASLTFAALHPELVDGVVAMNGTANLVEYENFQDAIRQSYGGTKAEVPDEYRRRSAELWPDRLTMPIACTTGGQDRAVPPDSVVRLMSLLKQQGRPVLHLHRPTGGHSTNYADAVEAYEFVLRRLPPTAKQP
jgi:dipeptidyl aminopeptidase/acylaminoacyl peptidase